MTRSDWLMLLLERELDPIRIQKAMFLFAKKAGAPESQVYGFIPYNWGPMSAAIYRDLESLQSQGLVERVTLLGRSYSRYRATADGMAAATTLRISADAETVRALDDIAGRVEQQGFETLLDSVYEEYPEFATRSLFRKSPTPTT